MSNNNLTELTDTDIVNFNKVGLPIPEMVHKLTNEKQREILFFIDTISQRITNKLTEINNENNTSDSAQSMTSVIEQGSNFIIENPSRTEGKYAKYSDGRIATDAQKAPSGFLNPHFLYNSSSL